MAIDKDDIIVLLKRKGPLVPSEIKNALGGDTIIVGAILSEQRSKNVIKVSHLKKGGSPFYFLPGQEAQLEKFKELLDPKDQQTLEMLKERKVVQDASMELFYRVSLRKLKYFAKDFKLNTVYGELVFWRYHLVKEEDAIDILKRRYNTDGSEDGSADTADDNAGAVGADTAGSENTAADNSIKAGADDSVSADGADVGVGSAESRTDRAASDSSDAGANRNVDAVTDTSVNADAGSSADSATDAGADDDSERSEHSGSVPADNEGVAGSAKTGDKTSRKQHSSQGASSSQASSAGSSSQQSTASQTLASDSGAAQKELNDETFESTPFYEKVLSYLTSRGIKVLSQEQVAKNKEYDFIVIVETVIGDLRMFIRAKRKKKLNEGDVAPALLKAKTRELPCIFLTDGEFTKKSLKHMQQEYKGLVINKLD